MPTSCACPRFDRHFSLEVLRAPRLLERNTEGCFGTLVLYTTKRTAIACFMNEPDACTVVVQCAQHVLCLSSCPRPSLRFRKRRPFLLRLRPVERRPLLCLPLRCRSFQGIGSTLPRLEYGRATTAFVGPSGGRLQVFFFVFVVRYRYHRRSACYQHPLH